MEIHPRLAEIAEQLETTGWAAELCAPDWTLVWVSSQFRRLLGDPDDQTLGIGRHLLETRLMPLRTQYISQKVQEQWTRDNVPHMLEHTEGGRDALVAMLDDPVTKEIAAAAEPRHFPAWTSLVDWAPVGRIRYFGIRPRGRDGDEFGTIYIYGSSLPASLLALVTRGDAAMFERMARIVEPGRREAAVLFADLQSSGSHSRHLPSAAYFRLLQSLTTAMDSVIVRRGGIVGKHAGDGVTAFFLTADLGTPSRAARAAIEAARHMADAAEAAGREAGVHDMCLNVGVHWGGTLYMGQIVTDGRLEVTALGDEVNEGARIQETARNGAVLASKPLVERLDPEDAAALGIDPTRATYRALSELPGVGEKAIRDAGVVAVTDLRAPQDRPA
jgi:class 3 adenylate cyclase